MLCPLLPSLLTSVEVSRGEWPDPESISRLGRRHRGPEQALLGREVQAGQQGGVEQEGLVTLVAKEVVHLTGGGGEGHGDAADQTNSSLIIDALNCC